MFCKHGLELRHCPLCPSYEEDEMSERRFVIREIYEGEDPTSIHWITESELRWRLSVILGFRHDWTGEDEINFLLHGEKGHQPTPVKNDTDATSQIPWQTDTGMGWKIYGKPEKLWPDPEDILRMRGRKIEKDQLDEWEAWVQRLPRFGEYHSGSHSFLDWELELQQWFREMPRKGG